MLLTIDTGDDFGEWYATQLDHSKRHYNTEPDKKVLGFIYDVQHACAEEDVAVIQRLFRNGYCYYFALMLQDAFPGGEIMWTIGGGHICYKYLNVAYDITGVYSKDCTLVSYHELGDLFECFRHRGEDANLVNEMREFAHAHGISTDELVVAIHECVPYGSRIPGNIRMNAMRWFHKYKNCVGGN